MSQLTLPALLAPERMKPVRMADAMLPMLEAEREAGLSSVTYMTIPDIEIAFVGMNWPASSGPTTLTLEHLSDAVVAANDDPHVLPPRAKIGHTDPRFNEEEPIHDPFVYHGMLREDGSPAYGRYVNLRLVNDGASMRGDWIEIPDWLALAAPSAYPTRSLEGDWDIETPGGKRYSFVLTAVSIGGEWRPAIGCLEDLIRTLVSGPAAAKQPVQARSEPMPVEAAASVDAVIRTFWNDFAQGDRYWWWPIDVWVDPNQVIADDDEGHLYRVTFTTDTDGNVVFDDPVRVMQEFRDLPAVAASMDGQLATRFASSHLARPRDRVRANTNNEGSDMNDEQRKTLAGKIGLPEDATQEQIDEKLRADALDEPAEEEPKAEEPIVDPKVEEPVAASTVTVSAKVWEENQARLSTLEEGEKTRNERETAARRDETVAAAVRAGRIAPSERDHYRSMLDIDETKTTEQLAKLAAGRVPVGERGVGHVDDTTSTQTQVAAGLAAAGVRVRKEN